ncbi:hypothetical protein [Streptomyces guryensis]|uniref:Uncharacterized protein n=1 Tax=Streptomyces guryensis TaxID=2886947 RepID=A0A9Q3ZAI8_9ACTN|nr:hypothetical protein [Streptomyces guryensis]MCD9875400.1 hypothetical protein [Streptomyces guryensis]
MEQLTRTARLGPGPTRSAPDDAARRGLDRLVTAQSAVASELLAAAPLDDADDAEPLGLGLELAPGPEMVSGAALASGKAEPAVCGAVPLDAPEVGVRLSPGPGVPAEPPPTEVPLPGSFLTAAATGLTMITSTAVTVIIARANTRPVAKAYFLHPMDLRTEPPR